MAPTEPTQPQVARQPRRDSAAMLRVVVYVVAALALCVAIWALIEGGERDLWTRSSAAAAAMSPATFAW